MRHGWLEIPGKQTGDRTLEEQVAALAHAIEETAGKTVLDLGCAEGLIGREFAKAGATHVLGLDAVQGHIDTAKQECAGLPMVFEVTDIAVAAQERMFKFDIVLCLGIAHKLHDPGVCIQFAAASSSNLVLIRSGRAVDENGIITSKFLSMGAESSSPMRKKTCDSHQIMRDAGFKLERIVNGMDRHNEPVEYWRKVK